MDIVSKTLFLLSAGIYFIATLGFLGHVLFRSGGWLRFVYRVTLVGFCAHTAYFILTLAQNGYPYIAGDSDAYRLISWIVMAGFFALAQIYRLKTAGVFFVPSALIFLILSYFSYGGYRLSSPWVPIHLFLALIAFSVFFVSLVVGMAFIMQESQLKAKHLGRLVQRLPPLAVLDQIHYKALAIGLILLSGSILAGIALNKDLQGVFFTWDPKQIWVLSTWFLYVVLLNMRIQAGWRGRRGIFLSVLGFVIVVLAFFGLQHVPSV